MSNQLKQYYLSLYDEENLFIVKRSVLAHYKGMFIYMQDGRYIMTKTWVDSQNEKCASIKKVSNQQTKKVCRAGKCEYVPINIMPVAIGNKNK